VGGCGGSSVRIDPMKSYIGRVFERGLVATILCRSSSSCPSPKADIVTVCD
jgi:hypothetical protein